MFAIRDVVCCYVSGCCLQFKVRSSTDSATLGLHPCPLHSTFRHFVIRCTHNLKGHCRFGYGLQGKETRKANFCGEQGPYIHEHECSASSLGKCQSDWNPSKNGLKQNLEYSGSHPSLTRPCCSAQHCSFKPHVQPSNGPARPQDRLPNMLGLPRNVGPLPVCFKVRATPCEALQPKALGAWMPRGQRQVHGGHGSWLPGSGR